MGRSNAALICIAIGKEEQPLINYSFPYHRRSVIHIAYKKMDYPLPTMELLLKENMRKLWESGAVAVILIEIKLFISLPLIHIY